MSETPVLKEVRLAVGSREDARVFRNNVGAAWQGHAQPVGNGAVLISDARRVKYGLFNGSGDLIGWHTIAITPDMVGKRVAVFMSIETKAGRGKEQDNQRTWAQNVRDAGGIAGFAKDKAQALQLLWAFVKDLRA